MTTKLALRRSRGRRVERRRYASSFQPRRTQLKSGTLRSKHELHRDLDLPRSPDRRGKDPRRGAVATAGESDWIRVREIGVIEKVEGLCPELQIQSLIDSDLLEEGSVDVDQVRAAE